MIGPDQIYRALTTGAMQAQGSTLSEAEKKAVAEHLGGRTLASGAPVKLPACRGPAARFDFSAPPPFAGWGMTPANHRYVPAGVAGLDAADVPRLALKWAFAFPGATQARSQPTLAGGAIYVGSPWSSPGRPGTGPRSRGSSSAISSAMPMHWMRRPAGSCGRRGSMNTRAPR
jgi:polyvinyl alcohol dehydrogenase (cytochrome)